MQNPMQMMGQIKQFANQLQGNPEQLGRQAIQGMNQRELNKLQKEASDLYFLARQMGIMK